jgi:DNA topoisomerase-1
VERERDIQNFKAEAYFKITAVFEVKNGQGKTVSFRAAGPERFDKEGDAEDFLRRCNGATFSVDDIRVSPTKRKPAAPFTTSTLQQEAGRKLGFSVNRTMGVAQRLYEAGHISYMRTDSTNLSETALTAIAAAIEQNYGQRYVQTRRFKTNKAGAQEAHEAIRPTYIENLTAGTDRDEQRLYELIWKRTIASQMADAELEKTVVDIAISTVRDAKLVAEGEVLRFDGFLKVYLESTDDDEDEEQAVLPPMTKGQVLDLREMSATERFTRPPARFSEPSLVKKLEELGIGRPSTYAPTITKIMEETRGYVRKENRDGTVRPYRVLTLKSGEIAKRSDKETVGQEKNKLFATDMGFLVVDFLDEHFKKIMDYGFTAGVEDELDRIAEGKVQWAKFLDTFYGPFHQDVEKTLRESERVSGERILGKDPKSGRTVLVRMSRLGKPVAQIGKPDELAEKETPRYGNLKPGQNIETISLEEALSCFDLPKTLGEHDGQEIVVGAGKFGPYVKIGSSFISLPKGEDPHEVTLERALAIVEDKRRADAPIGHFEGKPITKGSGRFGPFVKWDDLYVNIPKGSGFTIQTITEEGAIELIRSKREKESNKFLLRWEEENISVEIGRWGPFIRVGKQMFRLPPGFDGKRMTAEEAANISLAEVKRAIAEQGGATTTTGKTGTTNGKGGKKK